MTHELVHQLGFEHPLSQSGLGGAHGAVVGLDANARRLAHEGDFLVALYRPHFVKQGAKHVDALGGTVRVTTHPDIAEVIKHLSFKLGFADLHQQMLLVEEQFGQSPLNLA